MAELQRQFASALADFMQSDAVQLALRGILLYLVVVWLAAAWWAFRDMQERTGQRLLGYVAAAWVIAFSPLFFPFALLVYRLARPPELLADLDDRRLTEAALLADVDAGEMCPRCGRTTDPGWTTCPTCRTRLARMCPSCGRTTRFDWLACAWCAAALESAPPVTSRTGSVPAQGIGRRFVPARGAGNAAQGDASAAPPPFLRRGVRVPRLRPTERSRGARAPGIGEDRRTA